VAPGGRSELRVGKDSAAPPFGSHNQFRRFCPSLLAPGSERFRPVGCSPSTAPAAASGLLLASVVHDLRLAPDGSHQAFFG
jgi:hypothetical protein